MATKDARVLFDVGQGISIMLGLPKIPSWNITDRPKDASQGTFGFNSQTNKLEYCDGTSWFAAPMVQS